MRPEPLSAEAVDAPVDLIDRQLNFACRIVFYDRRDGAILPPDHPAQVAGTLNLNRNQRNDRPALDVPFHQSTKCRWGNKGYIGRQDRNVSGRRRRALRLEQSMASSRRVGLLDVSNAPAQRLLNRFRSRSYDRYGVLDAGTLNCVDNQRNHLPAADAVEHLGDAGLHPGTQSSS